MKITEKIIDAVSGKESIIERDLTPEEVAEFEAAKKKADEIAKLEAEAETKRAALLEKLGITEEEAKLLLG